jgi:hypothetical protein
VRLGTIASEWTDDPRFAIVAARLAVARGDAAGALETLRPAAEAGDATAAERYYSVLLWDRRWREARDFAVAAARHPTAAHTAADWLERAGDAAFQLGDARGPRLHEGGARAADRTSLFLKLADAAFVLEDVESERRYRERYYGTLREP